MPRRVVEDMIVKGDKRAPQKGRPAKEPSPFLKTLQKDLGKPKRFPVEGEEPLRPPLPPQEPPFRVAPQHKNTFFKKWYAFALILILGGGAFIYFSSKPLVEIAVTPKNETRPLDVLLVAGASGDVPFSTIDEKEEITFTVPATGSKDIDRRAQGQIVIFNSYAKTPQRLAARTRFEGKGGKIFRISSAVSVPGYTVKDGKIVPGSIEVTVNADETGEEYNIGLSDFTLPGLKSNAAQYAKIIARSKTEITGGFSGKIKTYDEALVIKQKTEQQGALGASLEKKVKAKIPADSVLFDKALVTTYSYTVDDHTDVANASSPVNVVVKGEARAVIFKSADLSRALSESALPGEMPGIQVENINALEFIPSEEGALLAKTLDEFTFSLRGQALFVWPIPIEEIQKNLAGTSKDATLYQGVFKKSFPTITAATVKSFRPFWIRHFPNDPSKIIIKRTLPVETGAAGLDS